MTNEEFWERLAERARKRKFVVRSDMSIREEGSLLCPVCAVCDEETGSVFDNADVDAAGFKLSLGRNFTTEVILAADGNDYELGVRAILLAVTGAV